MNICEFCKKEFTTKSNLLSHQRTTKYCLEIQGKNIENFKDFKCKYCDKNFTTTQNLNEHYNSCKLKEQKLIKEKTHIEYDMKIKSIEEEYKILIIQKDSKYKTEIDILNSSIIQKDQIIEKLEKKMETYEKRLFDMASRPTTNNTNSNNKTIVINNMPLTNEVLRQSAKTFYIDYAKNINGITRHFTESLEDHITCTDSSRNVFKYTNEKEEEIIDTDLENIIPQYLIAIKDENNFLYKEVFEYFTPLEI
jgi:hypothetical protein